MGAFFQIFALKGHGKGFSCTLGGLVWFCILFGFGFTPGCTPDTDQAQASSPVLARVIQDGVDLPQFSTAADQLTYAKSRWRDQRTKKAALRAVLALFPENKFECGQASLCLAYLHLEPDYRFAKPIEIRKAVNDFKAILRDFPALLDVQAKAHWYLGWILTDLENQPQKGLSHYWKIVHNYPDIPMNLTAQVPWINLVYSQKSGRLPRLRPSLKYWSQIALLEIVRQERSQTQALKAFLILFDRFFSSDETGLAIKFMLKDRGLSIHAWPKIEAYLSQNTQNPYLAKDIRFLAGTKSP